MSIHQKTFPRDHADKPSKSAAIIRARPFTVAFERFVDGDDDLALVAKALEDIRSDPSMRLEFEIGWAIVWGRHDDPEALFHILGCPNGFDATATRALDILKSKTDAKMREVMSRTDQRRQNAGEAHEARMADRDQIETKLAKRRARVVVP